MDKIIFGVNITASAATGADPVRDALAAEEAGADFISTSDHPIGPGPTFESWTMLSWIAAATKRVTVAPRVLGVGFRVPGMVAKMAETLDRLSAGRLVLGLGAGSSDDELRALGLPAPASGPKIEALRDAVKIIRGLWSEETFTYHGAQYHTAAATLQPKPSRRIPIWLGTFGPRGLALTGELADGWIPSLGYRPTTELPAMLARVREAAAAAGRRSDEIVCALNLEMSIGGTPADAGPDALTGPAGRVAEQLLGFVAMGFRAFSVRLVGDCWPQQVARLASEVMPAVRAGA